RSGMTPLICAAFSGNAETVAMLIDKGAKVDARAADGRTALMYAAGWGDLARVKAILAAKSLQADEKERRRVVNMVATDGGWTALMFAAARGTVDTITALIDAGADIDARNKWRQTALMAAVRVGDKEKVRTLLDAKASVKATDTDANTPLSIA